LYSSSLFWRRFPGLSQVFLSIFEPEVVLGLFGLFVAAGTDGDAGRNRHLGIDRSVGDVDLPLTIAEAKTVVDG
jgi:hypothetical protein